MTREEQDRLFHLILKMGDAIARQDRAVRAATNATSFAVATFQELYAAYENAEARATPRPPA